MNSEEETGLNGVFFYTKLHLATCRRFLCTALQLQLFTIPKIHVLRLNWPKIEQFEKTAFVCLFVCLFVCVCVRACLCVCATVQRVLANKCDGHLSILIKFINTWKIFCSSLTSLININR